MSETIDFEHEGLLEGCEDEQARASRRELLERLHGMPRPVPGERVLTDEDLEAAERAARLRGAGLPEEGMLQVARAIGRSMETVAYRVRLRDTLRRDTIAPEALESGELTAAADVAVGFADLVGFTRLGEQLAAADVGRLVGELAELAERAAQPPVTLVKTIGDAAMLVSREPAALVDALLELVAGAAGEHLPQLRAGAARGQALGRDGDWYGRPVNRASRIAALARPGSVLVASEVYDAVAGEAHRFDFSRAPARHLKGVEARVSLYRVRRPSDPEAGGS